MSSFLCFLCHSTVNADTTEETRDKYREVVGMHLCPDSHLCHICCHMLNKLCLFRAMCLKRSLEYPVLFSEKGSINIQRYDLDNLIICDDDSCDHTSYTINKSLYTINNNTKTYIFKVNDNNDNDTKDNSNDEMNRYVDLAEERLETYNENFNETADDYINYNDEQDHQNDEDTYNDSFEDDNLEASIEDDIEDTKQDIKTEIDDSDDKTLEVDNIEDKNDDINDLDDDNDDVKLKKDKKAKKVKKKSFTKIVLSLKEQRAVLDAQRKEKKYLEAEFKCHSCALSFLFKDTYQSHMVRHEESNGQYSCPVCGLRFATQNAKCMHLILHTELHRCNKCGAEVKRPHRSRHARECWKCQGQSATCHLCGNMFKDPNCLQQHLKRYHLSKSSSKVYSCSVCARAYNHPAAVRTHMLKHINRRFECDVCPSTFTSPYTLTQHKKKHTTTSEPLYCRTCDTWYDTKKSLDAHLRNTIRHQQNGCRSSRPRPPRPAHPPRPRAVPPARYTCHMCGHQAKSLSKLNRHIKEVCERAKLEEQLALYYDQDDDEII